MKHCQACGELYEDEYLICPRDSYVLEASGAAEPEEIPGLLPFPVQEGVLEPKAPRRVDTGSLVAAALDALEGNRTREREALLERMHQLERYNTCCHAVWRFVYDLANDSDHFSYSVRTMDEYVRMWNLFTLTIGEGRHLRHFPIRVTYDRDLGHSVTLEVDLEEIGTTRDERIERTEAAGGRASVTRFGRSYTLRAPQFEDEETILAWLRRSFWSVFRLAYGVE